MDRFVAAIIKGLKEHGNPARHFGSLIGLGSHMDAACRGGYTERAARDYHVELTAKGRRAYEREKLSELPDCRAVFWDWTPRGEE